MGQLEPCTCVPDCGCSGEEVKPPPKCDNSNAPAVSSAKLLGMCLNNILFNSVQKPDCTADKATYCSMDETNSMDGKTYKNTMCLFCGVDLKACNNAFCERDLTAVNNYLPRKTEKYDQKSHTFCNVERKGTDC